MYKVGIIGLGFMGGCIARTLSQSSKVESIIALDINVNSLKEAKQDGTITEFTTDLNDFKDVDVLFICIPVGYIAEYVEKLQSIVKKECVITDISSTKAGIIKEIEKYDVNFVGAHPMVGSERTGYSTSNDYLFENTYYILTENNNKESVEKVEELIKELKAIPIIVDAEKHDYIVAVISHIPQIVASSLVKLVKQLDDPNEHMKTLAAGGFKDITRIASSDPTMWEHICLENKDEIVPVLDIFMNNLNEFKSNINDGQKLYNFFEASKNYRDSFANRKVNGNYMPLLNIKIKDEVGVIANVSRILAENDISIRNIGIVNNRETLYGALSIECVSHEEQERAYNILIDNNYEVQKV